MTPLPESPLTWLGWSELPRHQRDFEVHGWRCFAGLHPERETDDPAGDLERLLHAAFAAYQEGRQGPDVVRHGSQFWFRSPEHDLVALSPANRGRPEAR